MPISLGSNVVVLRRTFGVSAIHISQDGGLTWDAGHGGAGVDTDYAWDLQNPNILYRKGANRLEKSTDYGNTWVAFGTTPPNGIGTGLAHPAPGVFVTVVSLSNKLVAQRTADFGETWAVYDIEIDWTDGVAGFGLRPHALVVNPYAPQQVYASTRYQKPSNQQVVTAIYRSGDEGITWQKVHERGDLSVATAFQAVIGLTRDILLVNQYEYGAFVPDASYVFRSTNGGITWSLVLGVSVSTGDLNYTRQTLIAEFFPTKRVWYARKWYSDDMGATWIDSGLTPTSPVGGGGRGKNALFFAIGDGTDLPDKTTDGENWVQETSFGGAIDAMTSSIDVRPDLVPQPRKIAVAGPRLERRRQDYKPFIRVY